jgi:hypothetical protein
MLNIWPPLRRPPPPDRPDMSCCVYPGDGDERAGGKRQDQSQLHRRRGLPNGGPEDRPTSGELGVLFSF